MSDQDDFDFSLANAFNLKQRTKKQTAQLLSLVSDNLTATYSQLNMPIKHWPYMGALIGASRGRYDWFDCSDFWLGSRLFAGELDATMDRIKRRVQRGRKNFLSWQNQSGFLLVEVEPGAGEYFKDSQGEVIHFDDGKPKLNTSITRYRLPVLIEASDLFDAATLRRNPQEYLISILIERLRLVPDKHEQGVIDYLKMGDKVIKSGFGMIRSGVEYIRKDPRGYPRKVIKALAADLMTLIQPDDDPDDEEGVQ